MKIRMAAAPPARVAWATSASPAGEVLVGVTDKGDICRVAFLRDTSIKKVLEKWQREWPKTTFCKAAKPMRVLRGKNIILTGTLFQQAVWRQITRIAPGCVRTYGDIAKSLGKPKACRAVGGACGANPVPLLVPCHRVVGATCLGGFSGPCGVKQDLLKAESGKKLTKKP